MACIVNDHYGRSRPMELAHQRVSSLQCVTEGGRVAAPIRVRGGCAATVGTHDVIFAIARHEA